MFSRKKIIFIFVLVISIIFGFRNGSLFVKKAGDLNTPIAAEAEMSQATSGENVAANNDFSLVTEPEAGIAPVLSAIQNAKKSVDVVMYQMEDMQIENALVLDETRGVSVRVLLNGGYYGVPDEPNKNADAYDFLTAHHVDVKWTPARFALTHQKTIVVDGMQALILTFNMTPQYYKTSRDFAVVDTNANDVSAIEETFLADWSDQNILATSGDDLLWSPNSENELLSLIENAQTSILIYNEEMNDTDIVNALVAAAKRGVLIQIVMTDSSQWHKNFAKLTAVGVKIRTFSPKAALYIHAKMILADNSEVFVGSENFSPTSLLKNRELGLVLTNPALLKSLSGTFLADFSKAIDFQK